MHSFSELVREKIRRSASVIAALEHQEQLIDRITATVRESLKKGARLYSCGNGGSAADALHLAEELIGRYKTHRDPWPAVCLNADPTALTCIANDYGFEMVFSRQIEALGAAGDLLVVFSTSGNSPNILAALRVAQRLGLRTIALLGKGGGPAAQLAELALIVDAHETEHVQEAHQVILHLILEVVEAP